MAFSLSKSHWSLGLLDFFSSTKFFEVSENAKIQKQQEKTKNIRLVFVSVPNVKFFDGLFLFV